MATTRFASFLALALTLVVARPEARAAQLGADLNANEIDRLLRTGRRMKLAGQVLIRAGSVAALAATVTGAFGYAIRSANNEPAIIGQQSQQAGLGAVEWAALGAALSSAASLAVGISLLAEGGGRIERARALVGAAPLRFTVAAGSGWAGAAVSGRW